MKFGDRLYWALQNKHDLRSVREKVDDAVHLAFDKALKYETTKKASEGEEDCTRDEEETKRRSEEEKRSRS